MENSLQKGVGNPQYNPEDLYSLGKFLRKAREAVKKSLPEVAAETGYSTFVIKRWETIDSESSIDFVPPPKEILPLIARSYVADIKELTAAWEISKQARDAEKKTLSHKVPRVYSSRTRKPHPDW